MANLQGPAIILAYALFFALSMVFLKMLYDENMSVGQANTFSCIFQTVFSFGAYMFIRREGILKFDGLKVLAVLALFIGATVFRQIAVDYADAGNCASFLAIVPLFAAPLSLVFNPSDKFKPMLYALTAVLHVIGVILIVQPPFFFKGGVDYAQEAPGYILMALSVFLYAAYLVIQRTKHIDEYFVTFWSSVSFLVIYFIILVYEDYWIPLTIRHFAVIVLHAFFRVCAGVFLALGSARTSPTLAGVLILTEVPFTYALQWLILHQDINLLCAIGATILLFASINYKYWSGKDKEKKDDFEYTPIPDKSDESGKSKTGILHGAGQGSAV